MRFISQPFHHLLAIALITIACAHALPIVKLGRDLQASFLVPCVGCASPSSDPLFFFDFVASRSDSPCGSTDVKLNGQPLVPSVIVEQEHLRGRTQVESYGQQLGLIWSIDCLRSRPWSEAQSDDDAQVVTLSIESLDGQLLQTSAGFTLSFRSSGEPSLLRLDPSVVTSATTDQEAEDWRNPPSSLRLKIGNGGARASAEDIQSQLAEIRRLELEAQSLDALIFEKKQSLSTLVSGTRLLATGSPASCQTFSCLTRTAITRLRGTTSILFSGIKSHSLEQSPFQVSSLPAPAPMNNTKPTTMPQGTAVVGLYAAPTYPPSVHLQDGRPGNLPSINEKTGGIITHDTVESEKSEFSQGRGFLAAVIKFILIVTGLAALFRLFSRLTARQPTSLRKIRDQAARREETRAARAYRRSARRQALHDWWHGHRRTTCGNTRGCEEKSNLIRQQESLLEEEMQNEIRQLAIEEETRRMRSVFNAGDELMRAEEGMGGYARSTRSTSSRHHPILPPYSYNATNTQQIMGFTPILIQSGVSTAHPTGSTYTASSHRDFDPQPLSRTSSLPDYRSEAAFSDPPSYHTYDTDRENFTDTDDDSGSAYDNVSSPRSQFSFDQPSVARSAYIIGGRVVRVECPDEPTAEMRDITCSQWGPGRDGLDRPATTLEQRGVVRGRNGLGLHADDSMTTLGHHLSSVATERTFV